MQDAVTASMTTSSPSPLIGVAICVCGNTLISLSLNLQKLAHQRLAARSDRDDHDGSEHERTSERAPLLRKLSRPRIRTSVSDPDLYALDGDAQSAPRLVPVREVTGEDAPADTTDNDDDDKDDHHRKLDKSYLKSPLWYAGMLLLIVGELGNFAAYAFAPASLVAPLGSVALIANCFFAPLLIKEPFRKQDILGIGLALLGGATVVYASKNSDKQLLPDEMRHAIAQPFFVVYSAVCAALLFVLGALSRTRWGDRFLMIDIGICALAGGFTVLSTKAISSFLTLIFLETFKYWITYPILAVLVGTALLQVNFVNKALQRFEARVVVPAQFCSFALSSIVGSGILYREFDNVTPSEFINFLFGCGMSAFGVWILTRSNDEIERRKDRQSQDDSDTSAERVLIVSTPTVKATSPLDTPRPYRPRTLSVSLGGQYLVAHSPTSTRANGAASYGNVLSRTTSVQSNV